ncbi:hypothetical protein CRG98_038107, partial [Punica granatum]
VSVSLRAGTIENPERHLLPTDARLAHVASRDLKLGGGSYQREGAAKAETTADSDPRLLEIHRHSTPELVPLIARPGHPQRNSRLCARPVLDKSKTSGLHMTPSSNKCSGHTTIRKP